MIAASGATAGATLMPMVMKAQIMAAKADRIWVRAYWDILNSFSGYRTTPAMRGYTAWNVPKWTQPLNIVCYGIFDC